MRSTDSAKEKSGRINPKFSISFWKKVVRSIFSVLATICVSLILNIYVVWLHFNKGKQPLSFLRGYTLNVVCSVFGGPGQAGLSCGRGGF